MFSPFAHPLFTSFLGIGVGLAVNARTAGGRLLAPLLGYLAAVTAHATWNASAFFAGGTGFVTHLPLRHGPGVPAAAPASPCGPGAGRAGC